MIIDKNFSPLMEKVFEKKSFSEEEMDALFRSMIDGTLSDVRIASVLTAFRFLTLTYENILAVAKAICNKTDKSHESTFNHVVDCGGTGGDNTFSVNISTTAAIVAAASGACVAKFAGRSLSGKSGSSDVLKMLEISPAKSVAEASLHIQKLGICFLHSVSFYPALKDLNEMRKTLGFKTVIDQVFPLINPIPIFGQLVGVYHKDIMPLMVHCLKELGRKRALVVHGEDGLDEISVCSATYISKLEQGRITHHVWKPSDFGMETYPIPDLRGGHVENNAKVLVDVLKNKASAAVQNAVELNAAATVWCAQKCETIQEGLQIVRGVIASGKALKLLENWKAL